MRAWGDALRASNDALLGRDAAGGGDARGVAACYAEILASAPAGGAASSSTTTTPSAFAATEGADGPRRDACELMSIRFAAQLRLRRHADLGGDVASLGLLVPRGSTGGAGGEGGPPPWVPFGLRILAAHQLQYHGDGSPSATDELYALRDRATRTGHWNTGGMEIWRAVIDNSLVNAHVRKREWRLALRSLDNLMEGLEDGAGREVEYWCSRAGPGVVASDAERSRMREVVAAAARVELLSRQLLVLLQSGAISKAGAIQGGVRRHEAKFRSALDPPPPPA